MTLPASHASLVGGLRSTALSPAGVRAAPHVDADRLWQRLMEMAKHGATRTGGVDRQALSDADHAARRELIAQATALGLHASGDAVGNLFIRCEGRDPTLPPVLTGSHLDSQPGGGRFDGAYGVLAGIEAIAAFREAGIVPQRAIEVVAWMNEEGSRFAPGMMGSRVFSGTSALETVAGVRDAQGLSVGDELERLARAFPELPPHASPAPVAYIEAHIEQAPLLEQQRITIGVVTGIQGKRTFRVDITGIAAHAGTTPHRERKDALQSAVRIIGALAGELHDERDQTRFTVGRLDVQPNAPSVVPCSVSFSIDLRHPDSARLVELGDRVAPTCAALAVPCDVSVRELSTAMSLEFPLAMRARIAAAATALGLSSIEMLSAAGHDARYLNDVCPTGMIFVPCKDGISHSEAEAATPEDLAAGTRVLAGVLADLACVTA